MHRHLLTEMFKDRVLRHKVLIPTQLTYSAHANKGPLYQSEPSLNAYKYFTSGTVTDKDMSCKAKDVHASF